VDDLFRIATGGGLRLEIDLKAQRLRRPDGVEHAFEVEDYRRQRQLEGLDEIGQTLQRGEAIRAYEARRRQQAPWLFDAAS
jgi:3-isopropylmalate dehydratase, small subunit (EC 4.2.1.33)